LKVQDEEKLRFEQIICTDKKLVTEFAMIILHPERLSGQPDYRPYTAFYDTVG
jgi:hypothetical protein